MILQKVDLVDIQKAAMGAGQEAGLEPLFAPGQGMFQVQRADDAILRRDRPRSPRRSGRRRPRDRNGRRSP
jgi:hypothetical protein